MSTEEETSQKSKENPAGNTKTAGFQVYRYVVTLPYEEIDAEGLSQHLQSFCKKFTFQAEQGENTNYKHWQIELSLKEKLYFKQFKNLFGFDKAHIEQTKNYFSAKNYCSKKETRIEGPYTEKSVFLDIITNLYEWQRKLRDELLEKPNKRKVVWIWDNNGNSGKTEFAKYMAVKHNATVLNNGKFSDLAMAIPDKPNIIIFNLPREVEGRVNYSAIECVKDGMIFSGKYESRTKIFNNPHVVIFANFEPEYNCLSKDRWEVREL